MPAHTRVSVAETMFGRPRSGHTGRESPRSHQAVGETDTAQQGGSSMLSEDESAERDQLEAERDPLVAERDPLAAARDEAEALRVPEPALGTPGPPISRRS